MNEIDGIHHLLRSYRLLACELIAGESQDLQSPFVVFIIQLGKLGIICCVHKFTRF